MVVLSRLFRILFFSINRRPVINVSWVLLMFRVTNAYKRDISVRGTLK